MNAQRWGMTQADCVRSELLCNRWRNANPHFEEWFQTRQGQRSSEKHFLNNFENPNLRACNHSFDLMRWRLHLRTCWNYNALVKDIKNAEDRSLDLLLHHCSPFFCCKSLCTRCIIWFSPAISKGSFLTSPAVLPEALAFWTGSEALIATDVIVLYVILPLLQIWRAKSGGFQTPSTRQCKFCGQLILFVLLINGRWQVQNLDNTLHQCVKDAFGTPTRLGSGAAWSSVVK